MNFHKPESKPDIKIIGYDVEARPLKITGTGTTGVSYDKHAIVRIDTLHPEPTKKASQKKPEKVMMVLNPCIPKPKEPDQLKSPVDVVDYLVDQFDKMHPLRYWASETGDQFSVLMGYLRRESGKGFVPCTIRDSSRGKTRTPISINKGAMQVNFYLLYIHNYNNSEKHGSYFIEVEVEHTDLAGREDRAVFHTPTNPDKLQETIQTVLNFLSHLKEITTREGNGPSVDGFKREIRMGLTGAFSMGALKNTKKERAKERMQDILNCEKVFINLFEDSLLTAFLAFVRYYGYHIANEEARYFEYFQKRRIIWNDYMGILHKYAKIEFPGCSYEK